MDPSWLQPGAIVLTGRLLSSRENQRLQISFGQLDSNDGNTKNHTNQPTKTQRNKERNESLISMVHSTPTNNKQTNKERHRH